MTNEEAIKQLKITRECDVDTVAQIKALDVAINALSNRPTGEPMTLEQLREMDGQPVWIERIGSDSPEDKEWALVFCKEKFCRTSRGNIALFGCYGIGWLAYAYPPAHIDREAWTAEWRELHGDKMVGLDDCGEDVYRHYHYSVCTSCGKGTAVKSNFCPSCGRAMTPEAWAELEKRLRG